MFCETKSIANSNGMFVKRLTTSNEAIITSNEAMCVELRLIFDNLETKSKVSQMFVGYSRSGASTSLSYYNLYVQLPFDARIGQDRCPFLYDLDS